NVMRSRCRRVEATPPGLNLPTRPGLDGTHWPDASGTIDTSYAVRTRLANKVLAFTLPSRWSNIQIKQLLVRAIPNETVRKNRMGSKSLLSVSEPARRTPWRVSCDA